MFGKIVIMRHPGHVQSFDKDRLVLAYDLCREFLKGVPSSVADSGVQFGYFQPGFLTIVAVLDLARQTALKSLQALFPPDERARIFKFLAVASRGQCLNAKVYADFGFDLPEGLDLSFNEDADNIALAGVTADRQIEDFGVLRQWAAPDNIQRLGLLGQCDSAISVGKSICSVASRLAVASGFKFGILRSLLEEVRESCIKIAERLLKNNRTDLGKEGFVRLLFPCGEFQCGIVIVNGFPLLLPGRSAKLQRPIVNISSAAEGSGKLLSLLISREEPVFESLLNYHGDILRQLR